MKTPQRASPPTDLNRHLIDALKNNDTHSALALVTAGADPNTRMEPTPASSFKRLRDHHLRRSPPADQYSPTALMLACVPYWHPPVDRPPPAMEREEDLSLLEAMFAHGANARIGSSDNYTALHYAVWTNRPRSAEVLLQHGADIDVQGKWGRTPLMPAAWNADVNMVRLLLACGAQLDVWDTGGETALHHAVIGKDAANTVSELLAHGADSNMCDYFSFAPVNRAEELGRRDLVLLLRGGAK